MGQLQVLVLYIYRTLTICNVYSYSLPADPYFNSLVELG